MNGAHTHPARKGSFSLKAIIHDVEQREGRSFSGPDVRPVHPEPKATLRPPSPKGSYSLTKIIEEISAREGCPVPAPQPEVSVRHHDGPRHQRTTRQVTLEGGRVAPVVTPLDRFNFKGAGRASADRSAPFHPERTSPWKEENLSGPEDLASPPDATGNTRAVLSLLPQLPKMQDEVFLLLYLDASREFGRRCGASGWYEQVLTMAARGR